MVRTLIFLSLLTAGPTFAGELLLHIVDDVTGEPVTSRIVLRRSSGKLAPIRGGVAAGTSRDLGQVIEGRTRIVLPTDRYSFQISRGPEYYEVTGWFELQKDGEEEKTVRIHRVVSMRDEGWLGGDPLAKAGHREAQLRGQGADILTLGLIPDDQLVDAETSAPDDVNIQTNLFRGSGPASDLAVFGIAEMSEINESPAIKPNSPSSDLIKAYVGLKKELSATAGAEPKLLVLNPMAVDLPIWLASGEIDGVTVLGEFLQLDRPVLKWPDSYPVDSAHSIEFAGPRMLGLWSDYIYQQILEAGFRMPPVGTAGAGYQPNPVGYSRTYVHSQQSSGIARWWDGLWSGQSVVTNGPLLRPEVNGMPPGYVFRRSAGNSLEVTVGLDLAIRDPVDYLEVIQDGRVVYKARLDEFARKGGRIPPLTFDDSGWMLVRVMSKYEQHYRVAISAPWYVEFDGRPRVNPDAVAFFQRWLAWREAQLLTLPASELAEHVPYVRAARAFWEARAEDRKPGPTE